jgi:hypothetical protein
MEALSWLGKASDVIHNLRFLQSVVDVSYTLALLALRRANLEYVGGPRQATDTSAG